MHACYAQCTLLPFAQHWNRTFYLSLVFKAYHLRREETDWFDKPRESRLENGHGLDRRLPEKLSHSRPSSQHQDQISCQVSHSFSLISVWKFNHHSVQQWTDCRINQIPVIQLTCYWTCICHQYLIIRIPHLL